MNHSLSELAGTDRLACPNKLANYIWVALLYSVLLFAAAWCVWALCTPLLGDDLMATFRMRDYDGSLLGWPRYAWGVWNHTNARIGDMLVPLWISILPRPFTALLLGGAAGAAIFGTLRIAGISRRTPLTGSVILLIIYAVLPWWDMDFYVCHFNYVWGTAFATFALLPLLEGKLKARRWLWIVPLVFIAVGTHEALAFPLACGLIAFALYNRKNLRLNNIEKLWVAAMLAAALFSISSRASYQRAGLSTGVEIPLSELMVETLPLVILLIVRAMWLALRGRLTELLRTRWLIFAVAAIVSAGFAIIGRVEGRGGWYAQIFALAALGYDYCRYELNLHRAISVWFYRGALVVAFICNAYVVYFGLYLVEMSGTRRAVVSMYRMAPDSPITLIAVESLDNEWVTTCMPLVTGDSISTLEYHYAPSHPLSADEPNPAEPVINK